MDNNIFVVILYTVTTLGGSLVGIFKLLEALTIFTATGKRALLFFHIKYSLLYCTPHISTLSTFSSLLKKIFMFHRP